MPAIESAHALAGALKLGHRLADREDQPNGEPPLILVSLSGRGDKDVDTAIDWFGLDTTGTGSESGARIGQVDQPPPGGSERGDLELGGHSTGAGREV